MTTLRDFGTIHRWIADQYFDGEGWVYNGCAARIGDDKIVYVCRARDMREGRNGQSHIAFQVFDVNWNPKSIPRLVPIITDDYQNMDTGPQDARVFEYPRGKAYVIFNMLCEDGYRRMHLHSLSDGGNRIRLKFEGSDRSHTEKNWTPFVFNGKLFFIYSFNPLVILMCEDVLRGTCRVVYSGRTNNALVSGITLRGGSPALAADNDPYRLVGYLHTTRPRPITRYDASELPEPVRKTRSEYRTRRFTLHFGSPERPVSIEIGGEVTFFGKQIEQVYGVLNGRELIVNVDDRKTVLVEYNASASM